jgi:hypothetical protein
MPATANSPRRRNDRSYHSAAVGRSFSEALLNYSSDRPARLPMNYRLECKGVPAKYPERLVPRSFQACRLLSSLIERRKPNRPAPTGGVTTWNFGGLPSLPCGRSWPGPCLIRLSPLQGRNKSGPVTPRRTPPRQTNHSSKSARVKSRRASWAFFLPSLPYLQLRLTVPGSAG